MTTPQPTQHNGADSGRPLLHRALRRYLPIVGWLERYDRTQGKADLIAGIVVLFITVPQVIAYAFLAGLPPQMGLFAAIAALLCYTCFGTSRSLAVGPTAVIAMMTLQSASQFAEPYSDAYVLVAMELAMMTGIVLLFLRAINFGAVVSFLSHAVVTAFISAAAILIVINQLPAVLGIASPSEIGIAAMVTHLMPMTINTTAVVIALGAMGLLLWCRYQLCPLLVKFGVSAVFADNIAKASPMLVVILGILLIVTTGIDQTHQIAVVGELPLNLPLPTLVSLDVERVQVLLPSALLIAMVVFLESTSIATAMASRRREKIDPNQELIGLGFANSCASVMGGFPVAGSFARTVVNDGAGAQTPLASLVTAVLVIMTLLLFGALFYYLPKGVLSAIVVVSAIQLIDLTAIKRIFRFNSTDAITFLFTFVG
ncbi:MAG: SulP family inorganic anion transporter, partial [Pseudomonadota bacterium]